MSTKRWTLLAVCLGTFMLLLDITVVNVALPDIQRELDASFTDLQWVVDAYSLMLASVLLTAGSLADLFGRRRVFAIGLALLQLLRGQGSRSDSPRPTCLSSRPAHNAWPNGENIGAPPAEPAASAKKGISCHIA